MSSIGESQCNLASYPGLKGPGYEAKCNPTGTAFLTSLNNKGVHAPVSDQAQIIIELFTFHYTIKKNHINLTSY